MAAFLWFGCSSQIAIKDELKTETFEWQPSFVVSALSLSLTVGTLEPGIVIRNINTSYWEMTKYGASEFATSRLIIDKT